MHLMHKIMSYFYTRYLQKGQLTSLITLSFLSRMWHYLISLPDIFLRDFLIANKSFSNLIEECKVHQINIIMSDFYPRQS